MTPPPQEHVQGRASTRTRWVVASSAANALESLVALVLLLQLWMTPAQLGVATLAVSLFPVLDVLADLGLGAKVARDGGDQRQLSTIFWLRVALSVFVCGLLAALAPALAALHGEPVVDVLLAAYAGRLLLQNLGAIPEALLRREQRLDTLARLRVLGHVAGFAAIVAVAAAGYPIWALVAGPLARTLVSVLAVQLVRPWWPQLGSDVRAAQAQLGAALSASASPLLYVCFTNVDYQIVGLCFGPAALGFYRAAFALVLEPARVVSDLTSQVATPSFARLRDDADALRVRFLAVTRVNLGLLSPFVAFLLAAAPDVVGALLPRYTAAVPTLRLLCVVALLRMLSFLVPPFLDAIGQRALTLRYMIVAAVVLPAAYLGFALGLGPRLGVESVALAWIVAYPIAFVALLALALPTIGLSKRAYLRNVVSPAAAAWAAGAAATAARAMAYAAGLPLGSRLAVAAIALLVILFVARVPSQWARRAPLSAPEVA
jgi:O-antigen/teichoic acid export membrane protein